MGSSHLCYSNFVTSPISTMDILFTFYLTHHDGVESPSDNEPFRCLKVLFELPGQALIYLIVDALDKCSNTSALLSIHAKILVLLDDLNSNLTNLHICMTSHHKPDIKVVLQSLAFCSVSIYKESGHMEDIEKSIKLVIISYRKMQSGCWSIRCSTVQYLGN